MLEFVEAAGGRMSQESNTYYCCFVIQVRAPFDLDFDDDSLAERPNKQRPPAHHPIQSISHAQPEARSSKLSAVGHKQKRESISDARGSTDLGRRVGFRASLELLHLARRFPPA